MEHLGRSDRRWTYSSANAGDRVTLTSGIVLDLDAVVSGVFDLPGD